MKKSAVLLSLVMFVVTMIIAGCSKGGGNDLHVKSPASGDKDLAVKSSYTFAVTKTFTDINQKITTAATNNVYAANYDLDAGNFAMSLQKPLTADDQVRVEFSLVGEQGTNEKSALKTGTYSAKADKYMKVESVGIVTRKGSADSKNWLDRSTLTGDVKLTSVSDDSISGDIDVSAGESSVKGSFTAKILKRK
jgi:hypothetical protein